MVFMMRIEYPWYVYFSIETLVMTIPYYGINLYDYVTRSKPWRHEIQKRKSQGIELKSASVTSYALIQFFIRAFIWYFHIYYKTMSNMNSISLISFILKMILSDGIGVILHQYQHSKFGRIFNHLKHHQLRTPTLASAAYSSIGELLLSSHLGWILMGIVPGSFWDHCLFLVVSSTIKRLCHSSSDHPWENTKLYRSLKLVGSHEHHVHHLHQNKNFADLFIFWDQLFGTFLDPKEQSFNLTCEDDYSLLDEEQRSFQPGWLDQMTNYSSSISNAFRYRSSKELDTYVYIGNHETYGGGGYVYEFRGRLSQLHQLGWIDEKTRAVFIQDSTSLFQAIISILYLAFIVYCMIVEIRSLFQLKDAYFRQIWCYLEWGIIRCSWAGVGVYVWQYREMTRLGDLFGEHRGYVNDLLTFLLGFCCFFGTMKLLRFCHFNRRLSLFIDTLQYAAKDLLLFTMTFSIVFIAFLILFYLLFISTILTCSSLSRTAQTLFEIILLQVNATELRAANTYLGPLCFTLYIFFVVFIGMPMFISIIIDGFRTVRKRNQMIYNLEHGMFGFMWDKFKRWTDEISFVYFQFEFFLILGLGIKKTDAWELQEERDKRMRSEYHHPIERLPEKFDQLLEALSKVKVNDETEVSLEEMMVKPKLTYHRRSIKTET